MKLLFLPGFCDPINVAKYSLGPKLETLGYDCEYAVYPRVFSSPQTLAQYVNRHHTYDVLIGHSLGGIVAHYASQGIRNEFPGPVVSVASPIDGLLHYEALRQKVRLPRPIPELITGIKKDPISHIAIGAGLDLIVGRQSYDLVIPRTTHLSIMFSKGLVAFLVEALASFGE